MGKEQLFLQKIILNFQAEVDHIFQNHIVSMIVYGSAVTDEYVHRQSDINILVVLDEEGIANLEAANEKFYGWYKRALSPLFLTESYINRSLDSFPIEFINIQSAYHVLEGKDVLQTLEFTKSDIRLQCERELKSSLLYLRRRLILSRGNKNALLQLIYESLGAFALISRALLYLKNKAVPASKADAVRQACKEFETDEGLFSRLLSIRLGEENPSTEEMESLIVLYIRQIDALSQYVDGMRI
jgi:predicted nucleotidyltransferase